MLAFLALFYLDTLELNIDDKKVMVILHQQRLEL